MEKEKRTVTLGAGSMERHGIDPDNNPNKVYIDTDEGAEKGHKLMDELKTAIRMRPDNIIIEGGQAADTGKGKAEGERQWPFGAQPKDMDDFINLYGIMRPDGHFFDRDTLKFFGERQSEMRLLKETEVAYDRHGERHECYVISLLQRNAPEGPTRVQRYFDMETFHMINPVDMEKEIERDKSGEGYILLVFREGLEKNEGDVTKTIGELGLEWADVLNDIRMRHGLETAMAERLGGKCAVEILDSKGKHGNPEQGEEPAAPKRRHR